jgi:N-sulfoglucosamine sulfohydrolase
VSAPLLLISAAGHGWHLGAIGTPALHTPRFDALAQEGTLYLRAYAGEPLPDLRPDAALTAGQPKETYAAALDLFRKKPATTVITLDATTPFANARPAVDPAQIHLPPSLPDLPVVRAEWQRYLSFVQRLDALTGSVLDALDRAGLTEETTVIYTSLHGPNVRRPLLDLALHVPLLARGPAIAPHTRQHDLVSLANLPKPTPRNTVRHENERGRTIFDGRFRYVRHRQSGSPPPLPAGWEQTRTAFPQHWRWLNTPVAAEELYDHAADPYELQNVAADPAYREHLTRLAQQ